MKRFDLAIKFQYNSCYCLSYAHLRFEKAYSISIQLLLLFIWPRTVMERLGHRFQYNSCYCLSKDGKRVPEESALFQYNSCYCLSNAFKPFFHFIIASFPDKINVSLNISQPSSIFSHFSPIHLQMAISRGLYAIINFIGWEISIPYRAERATRRV